MSTTKRAATVPEVAELLGVHPETVRRMIRGNVIRAVRGRGGRGGGGYRIPADEVERLASTEAMLVGRTKLGKPLELRARGKYLFRIGDRASARRCYEDAERASRELGDELGVAKALYKLGQIAFKQERWADAEETYTRAREIFLRKDPLAVNSVQLALGDLWLKREDIKDEDDRLKKAEQQYGAVADAARPNGVAGAPRDWAVATRGLGVVALERKEYLQARRDLEAAYEFAAMTDDRPMKADTLVRLFEVDEREGRYGEGIDRLERALEIYEDFGFEERARETRVDMLRVRKALESTAPPWASGSKSS